MASDRNNDQPEPDSSLLPFNKAAFGQDFGAFPYKHEEASLTSTIPSQLPSKEKSLSAASTSGDDLAERQINEANSEEDLDALYNRKLQEWKAQHPAGFLGNKALRRKMLEQSSNSSNTSTLSTNPGQSPARGNIPLTRQNQPRVLQHTISDDRSSQDKEQERLINPAFRSGTDFTGEQQRLDDTFKGKGLTQQESMAHMLSLIEKDPRIKSLPKKVSDHQEDITKGLARLDEINKRRLVAEIDRFSSKDLNAEIRAYPAAKEPSTTYSQPAIRHYSTGASSQPSISNPYPNLYPRSTIKQAPFQPVESTQTKETQSIAQDREHIDLALQIISNTLGLDKQSALSLDHLQLLVSNSQEPKNPVLPFRHQVIHSVSHNSTRRLYLDTPQWIAGEKSSRDAFMGSLPIYNASEYLSKHPDICCVVYRDYDISKLQDKPLTTASIDMVAHDYNEERIEATTGCLVDAIDQFLAHHSFQSETVFMDAIKELSAPYTVIYHNQDLLKTFVNTLGNEAQAQFHILLEYIFSQFGEEYRLVDEMKARGNILYKYVKYLFKPGDIVVHQTNAGIQGYMSGSWPEEAAIPRSQSSFGMLKQRNKDKTNKIGFACWSWAFDGHFGRQNRYINIVYNPLDTSEKAIQELEIVPLNFVSAANRAKLEQRGKWIWKCRSRCLVSYIEEHESKVHNMLAGKETMRQERYMIDMMMYRKLHKNSTKDGMRPSFTEVDELEPEILQKDYPPEEGFVYLVPLTINGYNFKRKRWLELKVDQIREVLWDKEAFNSLVIKEKKKRLIRAFISDHIQAERSTDLISGKGNGLILLLHGGPGTGKTLTAESVAEIAERPLYPVTCGDVGTEPEGVERYLESVLHIGKTWGCVVLMDEADVFLEQRSLEDLRRNALVSVFLRVLEYYEGILILTSNRVGTFDEAFKSRIQLAIHYQNLDLAQRTRIWGNFITRLENLQEEAVDFADLKDNIDKLATNKMNGREIRNVITTARQYIRWERQQPGGESLKLNYAVINDIMETAGEFNQYILDVKGGLSNDEIAAEDGLRVAVAD